VVRIQVRDWEVSGGRLKDKKMSGGVWRVKRADSQQEGTMFTEVQEQEDNRGCFKEGKVF
jgi:hypothetical protein